MIERLIHDTTSAEAHAMAAAYPHLYTQAENDGCPFGLCMAHVESDEAPSGCREVRLPPEWMAEVLAAGHAWLVRRDRLVRLVEESA
jgi:hypothetical protein